MTSTKNVNIVSKLYNRQLSGRVSYFKRLSFDPLFYSKSILRFFPIICLIVDTFPTKHYTLFNC